MPQSSIRIAISTFAVVGLLSLSQAHPSGNTSWPASAGASHGRPEAPEWSDADRVRTEYLRTPLRFERESRRDGRRAADFVARGLGYGVYLSNGHATVVLGPPAAKSAHVVTMRLLGSDGRREARGRSELPGHANHFIGNDRRYWQSGVRSFGEVEYRNVYQGVDLVYHGNQRQLEYDFIVAPGASHSVIAFTLEGAKRVALDHDGNLIITTPLGQLIHRAPVGKRLCGVR